MDFIALDFETANSSLSSICQVGMVGFKDGQVAETYSSLVDPCGYFDPMNVSIHGIDEAKVRGAPKFGDIYPEIERRAEGAIVVCHSSFDRVALQQATSLHELACVSCRWLDTTRVVRRTWPEYARAGYGLSNLTRNFGIQLNHHDAAEDARATGLILLKAIEVSGTTLDEWFHRVNLRIDRAPSEAVAPRDPNAPLAGEVIVFTGALSMPRRVAAELAAEAGCEVESGVTKDTTLLVVGDQDILRLAPGQTKSSKHHKAEALIAKGQSIRILCEADFREMAVA